MIKFENTEIDDKLTRLKIAIFAIMNISPSQLESSKRVRSIADARKVYSYIAWNDLKITLKRIGQSINKDHTSIIYSRNAGREFCSEKGIYNYQYLQINRIIQNESDKSNKPENG